MTLTSTFGFDDKKDIRTGHFADTYTLDGAEIIRWRMLPIIVTSIGRGKYIGLFVHIREKHNLSLMAGNALYKNVAEEYKGAGITLFHPLCCFIIWVVCRIVSRYPAVMYKPLWHLSLGVSTTKFNEKYLMTVTLRQDGSSVLAKDHQWGSSHLWLWLGV